MGMLRTFMTVLGRALKSRMFFMALFMVAIFRILDFSPYILQVARVINGKLEIYYAITSLYNNAGGNQFGLMIVMVPVLTYSSAFCDDLLSNHLTYVLMKTGKTRYCIATVTVCAISSFMCAFLGELLVVIVLGQFTTLYDVDYETFEMGFRFISTRILLFGLQGAFYGVMTMLLSVFTKSKFIIYTTPLLLYFFFILLGSNFLKISTKINPGYIFKYYIFGQSEAVKSVLYALVCLIFVVFLAIRAVEKKIERCY